MGMARSSRWVATRTFRFISPHWTICRFMTSFPHRWSIWTGCTTTGRTRQLKPASYNRVHFIQTRRSVVAWLDPGSQGATRRPTLFCCISAKVSGGLSGLCFGRFQEALKRQEWHGMAVAGRAGGSGTVISIGVRFWIEADIICSAVDDFDPGCVKRSSGL